MHIFFFIFLGLSFPAMAESLVTQDIAKVKTPEQMEKHSGQNEEPVESIHLCDPREETQMPETFY